MLEQFLNHITENKLVAPGDKILLAVSGGIDSMVMADLFMRAGFPAGVAHCNFQLRGAESDQDMEFVMIKAAEYGLPFHVKRFDTDEYARSKRLSIQMAARELRYAWFNELLREHSYTVIASAHQLNDVLETIILNLTRGTGLDGLTGIPVKQRNVIRPLLFTSREQIESYARENNITWREDSSNVTDDYQRNLIRNRVIPYLKEINPNLEGTFVHTLTRLNAGRDFARRYLKDFSVENISYDGKHILIRKEEIVNKPYGAVILWELVKDLGFNFDQCVEITKADRQPGQAFHTEKYSLTIDRDDFILARQTGKVITNEVIGHGETRVVAGRNALTLKIEAGKEFKLSKDAHVAQLDADKVHYPLVWRTWREGDRFIPLGMSQPKKISDFLIDEKVDRPTKDNVTVLESQGEIVWIVGRRIADPFKVTPGTKNILVIRTESQLVSGN